MTDVASFTADTAPPTVTMTFTCKDRTNSAAIFGIALAASLHPAILDHNGAALCYCNVTPVFFGLGGGVLRGRDTQVETVKIYEQHMLVQVDQTLHQRTIEEVKKASKFGGPVDLPRAAGSQIPG